MAVNSKQRKGMTLLVLLVAVLALIAVYVFVIQGKDEEPLEAEATPTPAGTAVILSTLEEEALTEVSFTNPENTITIQKQEDGTYILAGNPQFPLDQNKAVYIFDYVNLEAKRKIAEGVDLAEYGLNPARIRVAAKDGNGNEFVLLIGNESTISSLTGYFGCVEGENTVYLLDTALNYHYGLTEEELYDMEDGPALDVEMVTSINIESEVYADLDLVNSTEEADQVIGGAVSDWVIKKPFEVRLSADGTAVTEYLQNYLYFGFSKLADYSGEHLEDYGLKEPLTTLRIGYTEEEVNKEYVLYVGTQAEDGSFYVRQNDSMRVYTMRESNVKKLIDVDAKSLVSTYINLVYIDSVSEVQVECSGKKHTYEIQYQTVTADDGSKTTEQSGHVIDGVQKTVEESGFKGLYAKLVGTISKGFLSDTAKVSEEPVLTVRFLRNDNTLPEIFVEYLPYDNNYYAVRINGVLLFKADKRDINRVVEAVEEYHKQ